MRALIFFVGLVALVANLRASLQTVSLTPALLAKWTVTGAGLDARNNSSEITLPMASQVAHTYRTSVLAVGFTTQPTLGENSDAWPVFEMGSAALVFSRDDSGGHLVLAVGDAAPVNLPGSFALDADGRSVDSLAVGLSRVGAVLRVDALGKTFEFSLKNETNTGLVISAGSTTAWTFKNLNVTADSDVFLPDTDDTNGTAKSGNSQDGSKENAGRKLLFGSGGSETDAFTPAGSLYTKQKTSAGGTSLEIFTPPAVRQGRAQSVRAAAMESQRK